MLIQVRTKERMRHAASIKVYENGKYEKQREVIVGIRPIEIINKEGRNITLSAKNFRSIKVWIELNFQVLDDFWELRITRPEMIERIQPLE